MMKENFSIFFLLFRRECRGMANTEMVKTGKKVKHKVQDEEQPLKGALISVFLLGLFIIVTWAGVYFLFLDRF
jgi:Cytochrome c oxidase subunit IIa family